MDSGAMSSAAAGPHGSGDEQEVDVEVLSCSDDEALSSSDDKAMEDNCASASGAKQDVLLQMDALLDNELAPPDADSADVAAGSSIEIESSQELEGPNYPIPKKNIDAMMEEPVNLTHPAAHRALFKGKAKAKGKGQGRGGYTDGGAKKSVIQPSKAHAPDHIATRKFEGVLCVLKNERGKQFYQIKKTGAAKEPALVQITTARIPQPATAAAADVLQAHVAAGAVKEKLQEIHTQLRQAWEGADERSRGDAPALFKPLLPPSD